jgi:3'(2'), 5'-bisphosphate nucleotidase
MTTLNDLTRLVQIARAAGGAILEIYRQDFDVALKDDRSPLTQADLASHRVIRDALNALEPRLPLLSEESAEIPFATRRKWREFWLVDQLDGTKEFVNRNDEFTVNIALIRDHYPALGVVHVPVTGLSYFGAQGLGCFRQRGSEEPQPIHVRIPPPQTPVVVGSRSHANPEMERRLAPIGPHRLVSMGSSLKFCLVAEGAADFYPRLGPTSEWDTAAAQAVVEAAGGQVTTLDGKRLRYNARESVLNPEFLVFGDPAQAWPKKVLAI